MPRELLLAVVLAAGASAPLSAEPADLVAKRDAAQRRVVELIEQLGAPKYALRQAAAQELSGYGPVAFDQLLMATRAADQEVAAASKWLIETLAIDWVRPGDSPQVRQALESYGAGSEQERLQKILGLSRAPRGEGAGALYRIARFDASEILSRQAAVAAMVGGLSDPRRFAPQQYTLPASRITEITAAQQELSIEYGPSQRAAGVWLRLFVEQAEDPTAAVSAWRRLVEQEARAVANGGAYTNELLLTQLRWNLLRVRLAAGESEDLRPVVDQLVDASPVTAEPALLQAVEWMVEAGAEAAADEVIDSRSEQLTSKRGLYLLAIVRKLQGRPEAAEAAADRAFQAAPSPAAERRAGNRLLIDARYSDAVRLLQQGHAEWAWRELREAAQQTEPLSINAVLNRWRLADSLYDHAKYADAEAVLTEVTDAIDTSDETRSRYDGFAKDNRARYVAQLLPDRRFLHARRDFSAALAARDTGRHDEEAALLTSAISNAPEDADILIAMFRCEGGGDRFRQETRLRIRGLAKSTEQKIEQNPRDPRYYNEWAWLVGNTEGDFEKAIRYSEKSLELRPEEPGYLDTLGRCYFAAGRLQKAVEVQRRAVEGEPHMMVMRRQLALFEAELAKASPADEP